MIRKTCPNAGTRSGPAAWRAGCVGGRESAPTAGAVAGAIASVDARMSGVTTRMERIGHLHESGNVLCICHRALHIRTAPRPLLQGPVHQRGGDERGDADDE